MYKNADKCGIEIHHTILMICYNQEEFVGQALDSLLCEEVKPYEIIIGDDFSTDRTREILSEYKERYPEIIRLVLNENNVGIPANLSNIVRYVKGDVVSFLAGDDWYRPNFLQMMNKTILDLQLNPRTSKFLLMSNVVLHRGKGIESSLISNSKFFDKYTPVGLILRDLFHNQNTGISRALFNFWPAFEHDSEDIGLWTDRVQHIMFAQHMDKLVTMDFDGAVYRLGSGVSSRINHLELERSFQRALLRVQLHYQQNKLHLNKQDVIYLEFLIAKTDVCLELSYSSVALFFLTAWRVIRGDVFEAPYVGRGALKISLKIILKLKKYLFMSIFNINKI